MRIFVNLLFILICAFANGCADSKKDHLIEKKETLKQEGDLHKQTVILEDSFLQKILEAEDADIDVFEVCVNIDKRFNYDEKKIKEVFTSKGFRHPFEGYKYLVDINKVLDKRDKLAEQLKLKLKDQTMDRDKVSVLKKFFFDEIGFYSGAINEIIPKNYFVSEVMQDRRGVTIPLSIIIYSVCKKAKLPVYICWVKERMYLRYIGDSVCVNLDPIQKGITHPNEYYEMRGIRKIKNNSYFMTPLSNKQIIGLYLFRMAPIYTAIFDCANEYFYYEWALKFFPDNIAIRFEIAEIYFIDNNIGGGKKHLQILKNTIEKLGAEITPMEKQLMKNYEEEINK